MGGHLDQGERVNPVHTADLESTVILLEDFGFPQRGSEAHPNAFGIRCRYLNARITQGHFRRRYRKL